MDDANDPRITPARPDLAARYLDGKVKAARFVDGERRQVIAPSAPVRREPRPDALLDTEALKGELVTVYEFTEEGWSWGQLDSDRYVGWLPTEALRATGPPATHKVCAIRTLVFPGPSIRLPPIETLSHGSLLTITRTEAPFAVTADNGHVPLVHVGGLDTRERDFVAVAEGFLATPYLWGGKTCLGLDCSALVQLALTAAGVPCPRDSDMQEDSLGLPLATPADFSNLARGDLLFWNGHVAIVRDSTTLIHANAYHMAVAIEPIAEAVERIRHAGSEISSIRRDSVTHRGWIKDQ